MTCNIQMVEGKHKKEGEISSSCIVYNGCLVIGLKLGKPVSETFRGVYLKKKKLMYTC